MYEEASCAISQQGTVGGNMGAVFKLILVAVVFNAAVCHQSVLAEEGEIMCAAVLPCNPDGTVQAPYDQGLCASYYETVCQKYGLSVLSDQVQSCTEERDLLIKQNKRLRRQLKAVERQLME